jgi:hypothetical protein
VETIKGLREEILDLKAGAFMDKTRILVLESKWHVDRFIPENMTSEEVEEAAQLLLLNAVDLVKVIKYIQKKGPSFVLYYHRAPVYKSGTIMTITQTKGYDRIGR